MPNNIPAIPTRDECIMHLVKAGCSENVIEHCKTVAALAIDIAKKHGGVDVRLIECGALLHDIGRGRTHGIEHAIVGAETARKLNLDERLVLIIERHIGAGITQDVTKALGLEDKSYVPESMEEKIVAHADNMIVNTSIISLEKRVEIMQEQGIDNDSIIRVTKLAEEMMSD